MSVCIKLVEWQCGGMTSCHFQNYHFKISKHRLLQYGGTCLVKISNHGSFGFVPAPVSLLLLFLPIKQKNCYGLISYCIPLSKGRLTTATNLVTSPKIVFSLSVA